MSSFAPDSDPVPILHLSWSAQPWDMGISCFSFDASHLCFLVYLFFFFFCQSLLKMSSHSRPYLKDPLMLKSLDIIWTQRYTIQSTTETKTPPTVALRLKEMLLFEKPFLLYQTLCIIFWQELFRLDLNCGQIGTPCSFSILISSGKKKINESWNALL